MLVPVTTPPVLVPGLVPDPVPVLHRLVVGTLVLELLLKSAVAMISVVSSLFSSCGSLLTSLGVL